LSKKIYFTGDSFLQVKVKNVKF